MVLLEMILAYILAKLEAGNESEILDQLKEISGLKRASLTYGLYDICIEAQVETMEELDSFIFNRIRKIPGIHETVTLVTSRTFIK